MNQLVATMLAQSLEQQKAHQPPAVETDDVREEIAADAVRTTRGSIGALKGIATFARDRGELNLAVLLYVFAAERIAMFEGSEIASRDLGTAAALARRHGRAKLAEAAFTESLRCDPTNLRSSSALGQLLHHQGRYAEAAPYLEPASAIDNHALLFLGWSLLFEGSEIKDDAMTRRGELSLVKALRKWAYHSRSSSDRDAWLKQVRRLLHLGPDWRPKIEELVEFANANADWGHVSLDDVSVYADRQEEEVSELDTGTQLAR